MVDVNGTHEFAAPQELVWAMFNDPDVLARIVPGCQKLERTSDHTFEGQIKVSVGPVQAPFRGVVTLSDIQAPSSYHMVLEGRGPAGNVRGEGDMRLSGDNGSTTLDYSGSAQVSGRLATVGQRLMTSASNAIIRQSLANLDKQIEARLAPAGDAPAGDARVASQTAATPGAPPAAEAPGQADFALGVAREMFEDMVPDPRERQLITIALIALAVIGFLNWFANLVARRTAYHLRHRS